MYISKLSMHEFYFINLNTVFCFDFIAVFATGSRDGHIMIWDDRCQKKGKKKNNPICELTIFLQGSLVPLRKGNCMLIQTLHMPASL